MNPLAPNNGPQDLNSGCGEILRMAEQELAAFFTAVSKLFGSKQAELSAEDWLRELTAIKRLPASIREWRLITARASTRLASRLNVSSIAS
jgi:hypothetical protein